MIIFLSHPVYSICAKIKELPLGAEKNMKQIALFETEGKNVEVNKLVKRLPFKRVRDE